MFPPDPKKSASDPKPARQPAKTMPDVESGHASPVAVPVPWTPPAEPAAPTALSAAPSMGTLLQAVRRRWLMMVALGLLGAAFAVGVVWFLLPGQYTTHALLHVSSRPTRGGYESEADFINFQRSQAALLKSYKVLSAAVKNPEVAELAEVRAHPDPVKWLDKRLVTDFNQGPELLHVALPGDNPEDLAVVLNEVCRVYLQEHNAEDQGRVDSRIKQLQTNQRTWMETLRDKRQKLRTREEELGLDDPQTLTMRQQAAVRQLAAAQDQRLRLQLDLKKTEAELAAHQAQLKAPARLPVPSVAIEEELKQDPAAKKILERQAQVEQEIQQIEAIASRFAVEEDLKRPRAELATLKRSLDELRRKERPAIEARLRARALEFLKDNALKLEFMAQSLREQEKALTGEITHLEAQVETYRTALRAPGKLPSDVEALREEVAQGELVLKKIGDELGTLQAEYPVAPRVKLREAAAPPLSRDFNRQIKLAGAAGVGTFGLVVLGVVLLEFRNRRVYAADDVVSGLGINLVGTLPALPPHTRRALPAAGTGRDRYWQSVMTESVDVIRTMLLHAAQHDRLRVVMVTSAVGGEGKTSLASHLAASLARAWRKTLLLDCDLRNPAAHQQFDLPLEPGLCDVLRGDVEFDDAIRPTPVSRLWLMPAGKWDSHALQALAQEGVGTFFERLKKQYDFIIIDACPVLPVADSLLVGQHADAVLFSIMRDVSRMPAVYAAHHRLATLGIRMLGAVVIGEKADAYGSNHPYLGQPAG